MSLGRRIVSRFRPVPATDLSLASDPEFAWLEVPFREFLRRIVDRAALICGKGLAEQSRGSYPGPRRAWRSRIFCGGAGIMDAASGFRHIRQLQSARYEIRWADDFPDYRN